jgi:hypothetical protein
VILHVGVRSINLPWPKVFWASIFLALKIIKSLKGKLFPIPLDIVPHFKDDEINNEINDQMLYISPKGVTFFLEY